MGAYALGVRGQVRILATASVMAESLADDVADFLQVPAHHNIRVTMEERVSPEVIVRGIKRGRAPPSASAGTRPTSRACSRLRLPPRPPGHRGPSLAPAGRRTSTLSFEQTLDHEHVEPAGAQRRAGAAAARGRAGRAKPLVHRVMVSNFEAALRVVRANLAISVVPREVAEPYARTYGLRVMPLSDAWARRRFAICFRDEAGLSAAARLLVRHLADTSVAP